MALFRGWRANCVNIYMWKKVGRLFIIKTKWEAYLITYALATGAMERGKAYVITYPGFGGWLLFAACSGAVFMAGAKMLDAIEMARILGSQSD
jgi:hypothetical protein